MTFYGFGSPVVQQKTPKETMSILEMMVPAAGRILENLAIDG